MVYDVDQIVDSKGTLTAGAHLKCIDGNPNFPNVRVYSFDNNGENYLRSSALSSVQYTEGGPVLKDAYIERSYDYKKESIDFDGLNQMGPNKQVLENLGMSQGDSLYRDQGDVDIGMYLEKNPNTHEIEFAEQFLEEN